LAHFPVVIFLLFGFIQVCDVDEAWAHASVGLLTVMDEEALSPNKLYLCPVSTAIILERGIIMDNLQNLPQAICVLCFEFGLPKRHEKHS